MKKVIAVIVVLAVIWAVPPLRARAGAVALPVLERLGPVADFVANPIRRYSAGSDVTHIARVLGSDIDMGRRPPEPNAFTTWLRARMPGETGVDPWGNAYWMEQVRGTIRVGSSGADGARDTADDVVEEVSP